MALTKQQKAGLIDVYSEDLVSAKNVVFLKQKGVTVNALNSARMMVREAGGLLKVVKKRLFVMSALKSGYQETDLGALDASMVALYSLQDEYAALKVIQKLNKQFKKEGKAYKFEYLGGWFGKNRKTGAYVEELANLPSKEELVGKFLFLLKYPVQSFVSVLDKIKDKKEA